MNVGGLAGNNNVTLSVSFTNNQYQLLVQDSVNGGSTLGQEYLLSSVDSVNMNLGAGDDTLNCVGLFDTSSRNLPVYLAMGGGFNTAKLGGSDTFETFTVDTVVTSISFAGVRTANFYILNAPQRLELHGAFGGGNTFNIDSQNNSSVISR